METSAALQSDRRSDCECAWHWSRRIESSSLASSRLTAIVLKKTKSPHNTYKLYCKYGIIKELVSAKDIEPLAEEHRPAELQIVKADKILRDYDAKLKDKSIKGETLQITLQQLMDNHLGRGSQAVTNTTNMTLRIKKPKNTHAAAAAASSSQQPAMDLTED